MLEPIYEKIATFSYFSALLNIEQGAILRFCQSGLSLQNSSTL